jgi:hypothetical protein
MMSQNPPGPKPASKLHLIQDIYSTRTDEIQCDEAQIQMAQCASLSLDEQAAQQQYPALFQHFRFCADCEAEYNMLLDLLQVEASQQAPQLAHIPPRPIAITAASLSEKPSPLRRLIEALFVPLSLQTAAVRGDIYQYQTPQLVLNLYSNKAVGKARTWTLHGMVRTIQGQAFTNIEDVILIKLAEPDAAKQHASIEQDASFIFKGLEAGKYSLTLMTPEEEVFIRSFDVGFAV